MAKYVIKRDGRRKLFEKDKIVNAILSAFEAVEEGSASEEYAISKANNIADYIAKVEEESKHPMSIEDIQDLVEHGLMSLKHKDVAKAYILYREERSKFRNLNSESMKSIMEKLNATNVENSNANLDENSFGGRQGGASSALLKQIALNYIVSPTTRNNHLNNEIYIHDLDAYALGDHNCLSIPFDHLLKDGFNTRQVDIRPAGSVNTAFQLVAVIFQLQSLQQFGR